MFRRALYFGALLLLGGCALRPQGAPSAQTLPLPAVCRPTLSASSFARASVPVVPWRIVALGSSSTFGEGATHRAGSYPNRLQALLNGTWGAGRAEVVNKGVNGDTLAHMLARLQRDVYDEAPAVVIWQTGTNDALQRADLARFRAELKANVLRLQARGIRVVLLDSQYLPPAKRPAQYEAFQRALWDVAEESGAPLIPRYRIMQRLLEDGGYRAQDLLSRDGLHPNDFTYRCIATYAHDLLVADAPTGAGR